MLRSPILKALVPAVLTVLAVLIQALATDDGYKPELITAIVGLGSSALSYGVANLTVGLSRYLKALAPALMTVVVVLTTWVVTGEFSKAELAAALTGGLAALTALILPNTPALFYSRHATGKRRGI
ncbi:MAG: hypothetical protein LC798_12805 [Chloroflexi bacterium]|nr:hypothetical protein [Chloroflexota bacterium]